jgi:uncharacterized protein (TIGR02145 family)
MKKSLLTILSCMFIFSCDPTDEPNMSLGQLSLSLQSFSTKNGRIEQSDLENAASILVTIEKMDGTPTDYTLKELELFKVNGEFITEKVALSIGNYEVTEFLVLDADNNITYIAPLEGSEQAQNVEIPLPIQFTIASNLITAVEVEVLSTEFSSLEDFGLVGFNLSEVNLFQFLLSVSEQGNLEILLDGTLSINSEGYQFTKELQAIVNNSIVIKSGYTSYELTIEKEGYHPFTYSFSQDHLEEYSSIPFVVELVPAASSEIVDERDGQVYQVVQIGEQLWMAENLKAIVYNDGTPIAFPQTNIQAWEDNTSGAYALYNFDETQYGMLYNWYAVNTEKLCPSGWHIPSDGDWLTLSTFLGGSSVAGGKMKAAGTEHWDSPNTDASNSSGFSAYPAGWAYFVNGHFSYRGNRAIFWSSDEGINEDHGISRHLEEDSGELIRYTSSNSSNKGNGFSCRCVQND